MKSSALPGVQTTVNCFEVEGFIFYGQLTAAVIQYAKSQSDKNWVIWLQDNFKQL